MSDLNYLAGYEAFLREVKERIQTAQVRAAVAVSRELMTLYWQIGKGLTVRQEQQGWGEGALRRLASDLQTSVLRVLFLPQPVSDARLLHCLSQ